MASSPTQRFLAFQCVVLAGIGCSPSGQTSIEPLSTTHVGGGTSSGTGNSTSSGTSTAGGNASGGNSSTTSNSMSGTTSRTTGGTGSGDTTKPTGGTTNTTKATGGTSSTSTTRPTGGSSATNTTQSIGGNTNVGGTKATGGSSATNTTRSIGGNTNVGGTTTAGGTKATGGTTASVTTGPSSTSTCPVTLGSATGISSGMGTVGIVEWSTTLSGITSAQIVYTLDNAGSGIINKGGTAPVDLNASNYHTLLLGLKPSSNYTYHIEVTSASGTCKSSDYTMKTSTLSGAPTVTRTVTNAAGQAGGFIITSGGVSGNVGAYIFDADGTTVWSAAGPASCSRARMDYEGANMWMLALNVGNTGGEMRYISMDGKTSQANISGLSDAHHDFTVLPTGTIAAMVWTTKGTADPESNLIERSSSGTLKTAFKIGANLYAGGPSALMGGSTSFHCNSIAYHLADDSYTIGDRNPSTFVKVTRSGSSVWQIGGSCTSAPAPKCATGSWKVNHGHHLVDDNNLLIFNNGQSGSSHVFDFKISSSDTFAITTNKDFTSGKSSGSLGDVQRLPNGNTLITYSNSGDMYEVDSSWATVQTIKGPSNSFGYADWRETLYGPPPR
jgi:hypothetical protein